jgi:LacI family transcriptional regulator
MRRPTRKRTTILDIAMKLGLSAMTVSRALTGKSDVSEETKQKVLRCATALGYQPHRWARSLVTRRSSIVGVVIPEISHSFFSEITSGVEEIVDRAGYDILLCHSRGNAEKEKEEIHMLVGSMVAGLIVASVQPEKSPGPLAELAGMEIPFVLVDRFFPRHAYASVRVDDRAAGRLATQCLIDLGHRHIAHIQGPDISPSSLRYRGYLDALKGAGIAVSRNCIVPGSFDFDSGSSAMKRLLALAPRPTAVFAANDPMAVGAIFACRDAGLRVPEDISIVGAGNIEGEHDPNPFVTTLDWPREGLGRMAATLLLEAIAQPARKTAEVKVLEPKLLIRQSTARPAT